jgi:hypothetical protein
MTKNLARSSFHQAKLDYSVNRISRLYGRCWNFASSCLERLVEYTTDVELHPPSPNASEGFHKTPKEQIKNTGLFWSCQDRMLYFIYECRFGKNINYGWNCAGYCWTYFLCASQGNFPTETPWRYLYKER